MTKQDIKKEIEEKAMQITYPLAFKRGFDKGIQKAIDVVNNFDFVKLIHLGITGTVFNGYSKEEKEASKIVQDNLLEKLKEL